MEPKIKRKFRSFEVSLTNSEPAAAAIRLDDVAGGAVFLGPSPTAVTTLSVWASATPQGPFGPLQNPDGEAVEMILSPSTSQARVYSLPEECYGLGAIKLVAAVASATSVNCVVMLKG
jgi:hypothetical protein